MAENASTVFNVHVPDFVDAIWVALRDPTLAVRERAVEALRACLRVIEKRETRWRVQWYVTAYIFFFKFRDWQKWFGENGETELDNLRGFSMQWLTCTLNVRIVML